MIYVQWSGKAISENRRHVRRGARIYAGREYEEFVQDLARAVEAARLRARIFRPYASVSVTMAFRISPQMDAQNLVKPVCDALERGGLVRNDRKVGPGHWFEPETRKSGEPDEIKLMIRGEQ